MKLIIGLGNPGSAYKDTRHNLGFIVVKALGKDLKIGLKRDFRMRAYVGSKKRAGEEIILALPQTYMNLSGESVVALVKK